MQKRKIKNRYWFGVVAGFCSAAQIMPSYANRSNSVMLSTSELDIIGLRKTPGLKNGEVRLDGILYLSETEWTIWLNGQPYTPKHQPDNIVVLEVNPHRVEIKREEKKKNKRITNVGGEEDGDDEEDDNDLELPEKEKTYSLTIDQIVKLN